MKKYTFILAGFLTAFPTFSQKKFSPEDIWRLAMVSDPQASPDGKNILYGVKRTDLVENKGNNDLFIMNAEGEGAIQITNTMASEFNARWRPDAKKIGFLMADGGAPQFYEINPDGSGLEKISNEAGGVEGFDYSPKGDHILFYKAVTVQKQDAKLYKDLPKATGKIYDGLLYRHWTEWSDGSFNHVFCQSYQNGELIGKAVDLLAGEAFDAPLKPMGGIEQITWRPDGKAIVYTCKKKTGTADATSTNSDIYLYDLETKLTSNLSEGMMGYDVEPRFSPDGKKIAWQSMARDGYEADKNRLMVKDLKSGQVIDATQSVDITIESLVWSSNSQLIYFQVQTQGTVQIYEWDSKKPLTKSVEPITKGQHNYTSINLFKNGKLDFLLGTKQNMNAPNEIWKIEPTEEKEFQLTKVNAEVLSEFKLCKVEKRMVKATDGKDILTWVVYPPDFDAGKKYPTVLFCQGGPQSMVGQSFSTRWNFQLMASQGYIMVLPNRRGFPVLGRSGTNRFRVNGAIRQWQI